MKLYKSNILQIFSMIIRLTNLATACLWSNILHIPDVHYQSCWYCSVTLTSKNYLVCNQVTQYNTNI